MPRVLNKYRDPITIGAINIMRPHRGGNKFEIGKDGTRDEVCDKYEKWAPQQEWWTMLLKKCRGHDLVCCCKPLRCHGDFILREANK